IRTYPGQGWAQSATPVRCVVPSGTPQTPWISIANVDSAHVWSLILYRVHWAPLGGFMSGSPARLLLSIVVFVSSFALAADDASAQCNTTQLCPAAANPCEITAACTVPAGATFDLGNRAFIIRASKTLTVGQGADVLTIKAGSILLEQGAKIIATG